MEGDNACAPTLRSLSIVATATYPDNLHASPLLCHSPSWLEASWGSLHKPSHWCMRDESRSRHYERQAVTVCGLSSDKTLCASVIETWKETWKTGLLGR